ncbi:DNA-binding protein inhibitor ID-2 [Tupaia chinensis]|uniref:DNA-binding protein inhibitor ID-2 n=1 Tax=Tupaia chinensis TaxID=246437 RepID=L9KS76_TUPCH|nr:DNA-binding protein inhibitor ID-2 [Tupaia chinensis]
MEKEEENDKIKEENEEEEEEEERHNQHKSLQSCYEKQPVGPQAGNLLERNHSDDPLSLLYNMNHYYAKLKELVPSIPQNKKITLDSHLTIVSLHHQRPGQDQASRLLLTTLNMDICILSL